MPIEKIYVELCKMNGRIESVDQKLEAHINREERQLEDMYDALFDPDTGLVNVKKWMDDSIKFICRLATRIGIILGGCAALMAAVASAGRNFGWW
jgi:hypothetical protein